MANNYNACDCGRKKRTISKRCLECRKVGVYKPAAASNSAIPLDVPIATGSPVESFAVSGDSAVITKPVYERVLTLADLIKVCEIDTNEWEVERWVANKWEVGAKDQEGELRTSPLFQVKAWLRRRVALIAARTEIAALVEDAKTALSGLGIPTKAKTFTKSTSAASRGTLLEPSIPDLHIGKMAWAPETGWDNYDSKIAESVFEDALAALIYRTKGYGADRVLFPVGNDLLHSDSKTGMTTSGTQLDTDNRFQKSFAIARRMISRAIVRLRDEVGPVHVVLVPGNHDALSVWHLGDSLECLYHATPGITIDNQPSMRKYYEHGKLMLMFTHGNRGKLDQYPLLMAAEQPEMWGRTVHKEAHTGDKHHLRVQEHRGVKVRISPALCPPDAWHSEFQFVGAQRSAEAFVWSPEEGLIGTAYYTVPSEKKGGGASG